jgi:hypothetical protein
MSFSGFWWFCWRLLKRSFHGTLRVLEIGEAVVAIVVHVLGYFFPQYKESLERLFLVLVALLVVTFLVGILIAAYGSNHELEADRNQLRRRAEVPDLSADRRQEAQEQLSRCMEDEVEALRTLLRAHHLHGEEVRRRCPGVDCMRLMAKTSFLYRDGTNDLWRIQLEWQPVLTQLLFPSNAVLQETRPAHQRPFLKTAVYRILRELRRLGSRPTRIKPTDKPNKPG